MSSIRSLTITAALSVAALPAAAQTAACAKAVTQADMNRCAGVALTRADQGLNRAYVQALARLSPGGQGRLREAQRAWIVFRDRQCAFESNGPDGGSVAPMVVATCAGRLTEARTRDLASAGKCVEGDVSCAR